MTGRRPRQAASSGRGSRQIDRMRGDGRAQLAGRIQAGRFVEDALIAEPTQRLRFHQLGIHAVPPFAAGQTDEERGFEDQHHGSVANALRSGLHQLRSRWARAAAPVTRAPRDPPGPHRSRTRAAETDRLHTQARTPITSGGGRLRVAERIFHVIEDAGGKPCLRFGRNCSRANVDLRTGSRRRPIRGKRREGQTAECGFESQDVHWAW